MKLAEVKDKRLERIFLDVPVRIYKDIPEWVRPLDDDIRKVFDPSRNKFFRHGNAIRYVLFDDQGTPIGRVAAFVNRKTAKKNPQPTGGMGFFECINDQKAANMLLNACRDWNATQGMEAMDGPVNFGERDRFWGLLVEGFQEPVYAMNYNPPYYQKLFESFGFREYFKQYCYSLTSSDTIDPKFEKAAAALRKKGDYKAAYARKKDLRKHAREFSVIYNKAWAKHGGGKEISPEVAFKMFRTMKPVMEEKLIWFAYYKDEPVGFWISLPELNYYFRHFNGKFGLLQKISLLFMKTFSRNKKFYGLAFGVVPEHQGLGVDALMIRDGQDTIVSQTPYRQMELQWIGDFNPKMIAIAKSLGTSHCRTLITYRYMFDREAPYERMKVFDR
jgi:hypothetical protein